MGIGSCDNRLSGPADCGGGTRAGAPSAVKTGGGDSHCEFVDWANIACQDKNRKVGNCTIEEACKNFEHQGGVVNGDPHDCRYIVHLGTGPFTSIDCQVSHTIQVQDRCP
jgi:hypothetical protein